MLDIPFQTHRRAASSEVRLRAPGSIPRLWSELPPPVQLQIAKQIAVLARRMMAHRSTPPEEGCRADSVDGH
jgi:hypothetical protein